MHPSMLVIDDSIDATTCLHNRVWGRIGESIYIAKDRGKRISTLAALSFEGPISWTHTEGTYNRIQFHNIVKSIFPLNP